MVYADGLADVMEGDGETGEVALLISGFCNDGFFHCYDALVDDDDTLWAEAVDDLKLARFWCDTLIVFAAHHHVPAAVEYGGKALIRPHS